MLPSPRSDTATPFVVHRLEEAFSHLDINALAADDDELNWLPIPQQHCACTSDSDSTFSDVDSSSDLGLYSDVIPPLLPSNALYLPPPIPLPQPLPQSMPMDADRLRRLRNIAQVKIRYKQDQLRNRYKQHQSQNDQLLQTLQEDMQIMGKALVSLRMRSIFVETGDSPVDDLHPSSPTYKPAELGDEKLKVTPPHVHFLFGLISSRRVNPALIMHPLQLPEIRERLSRFIPFEDALACVLVSKAWCQAFTHLLWHTIDFDIHSSFQNLDPDIVAKHGGSIRAVRNLATLQDLVAVDYPSILNLHCLEALVEHGPRSQAYLADILCRNAVSLQELKLHVSQPSSTSVSSPSYISLDVFSRFHANVEIQAESYNSCSRTSYLTILDLKRVAMSRRAFSSLLQACPNLLVLKLHGTVLFGHVESSDSYFKHKRYLTIVAPLKQVLELDPEAPKAPSLLIHFPNIRTWRVTSPSLTTRIPLTLAATDRILPTIREAVATHCPLLTSLYLDCEGPIGARILTSGFENLTGIRIHHTQMSSEMITAILAHQHTLKIIATFIPEGNIFHSNEPLPFNNSSQQLLQQQQQQQQDQQQNTDWMWMIIPRCCTNLCMIEWPMYEMNMDDAEKAPWVCKWLGVLRIRIRGLDTKTKIDRAIQLWLKERSNKRKRKWTDAMDMDSSDDKSDDGKEDTKSRKKSKKDEDKNEGVDTNGDGGETQQQGNGQENPTDGHGVVKDIDGEYPKDDQLSYIADDDTSIEARVARHLLKLEWLHTVWLGTKEYEDEDDFSF
ncbi:MAG: hypothetical protein J3Q66DRAFT_409238 [Benniella sp.]|nr:MAG: hypothetical protein J3Q66DRAFT_409238 [Benniella sp.]